MSIVVVIQARTNSSRLPAKVLLPIGGFSLAILAAKRASNTGLDVIVATSVENSDDLLSSYLKCNSINLFRGSLNDTLNRFTCAIDGYEDDTIVVRLTADNVCPDGKLIEEVIETFISENLNYIYCNGSESGLPYGMSLEVTKAKFIREANRNTVSSFDREHVTPYIYNKFGKVPFTNYSNLEMGKLNCTVDNLNDYLSLSKVFQNIDDPLNISCLELCKLLDSNTEIVTRLLPVKFVLGTAQLGMNYGINNLSGKPTVDVANDILLKALENKVSNIDTASMYGNSESIIGNFVASGWQGRTEIITKLFLSQDELASNDVALVVENKIYKSLLNLRNSALDVLLLHRADYISIKDSIIWNSLLEFKKIGLIKVIGVSIQNESELIEVLKFDTVEHIQLPFNIMDWRWKQGIELIRDTKKIRKLTIHCRSAFLQGLLLSNDELKWTNAHVTDFSEIMLFLSLLTKKFNAPLKDILLSYVTQKDWVDGVVVGVETSEQLIENLNSLAFSEGDIDFNDVEKLIPVLDFKTLDPSKWHS